MLAAYFEMARAAIEAFGGTVEKFIGDAVVGVFGVPAAHEDDPERAVRAGLADLRGRRGTDLGRRCTAQGPRGRSTPGRRWSASGSAAASGEGFLTGDSINTASRIQSVAPEMGVAVGLGTYEATTVGLRLRRARARDPQGQVRAGAGLPRQESPRARFGTDLTRTHDTPFIGREIDLALLKGIFDKTLAANSPQLVTVVGEPGLGKSPDRRRARRLRRHQARPHHLAPGAMPALRGRHHLLGARRDPQGPRRHPGVRHT